MRIHLLIILCVFSLNASAQFFPLEAGLLGGVSSGMNFRAYLEEDLSYEALISIRARGAQAHLFRQQHMELQMSGEGSFYFVYGYGAHAGFYYTDHYSIFFQDIYYERDFFSPLIGIDGFAALEYRFHEIPISFGLCYKPYMELSLRQIFGLNIWDFGFSVKYRFKPQNEFY